MALCYWYVKVYVLGTLENISVNLIKKIKINLSYISYILKIVNLNEHIWLDVPFNYNTRLLYVNSRLGKKSAV